MGALALTVAEALQDERAPSFERTSIETCRNVPRIGHLLFFLPPIPFPSPFLSFHSFIPFLSHLPFHPLSFFHSFGAAPVCVAPFPFYLCIIFFTGLSVHLLLGVEGGRSHSFPSLRNPRTHPYRAIFFFFTRSRAFFFFILALLALSSQQLFFFSLACKRSASSFSL